MRLAADKMPPQDPLDAALPFAMFAPIFDIAKMTEVSQSVFAMTDSPTLTHLNPAGGVKMVDVGEKPDSVRTALASGRVWLGKEVFETVREKNIPKGDVLSVAQIAGIMGAKQTSRLLPLCHDLHLKGVDVELNLEDEDHAIEIRAYAKSIGQTGVEMEALTAVSIAALTVYDMCKSLSKNLRITDIQLLAKTGGMSGDYRRTESE
jgi:molybdenum cofactor biosynthesis protein MoaC